MELWSGKGCRLRFTDASLISYLELFRSADSIDVKSNKIFEGRGLNFFCLSNKLKML